MRQSKHLGCGAFVHFQTFPDLIIGDTFFDADFGEVIWNGKEWVDNTPITDDIDALIKELLCLTNLEMA